MILSQLFWVLVGCAQFEARGSMAGYFIFNQETGASNSACSTAPNGPQNLTVSTTSAPAKVTASWTSDACATSSVLRRSTTATPADVNAGTSIGTDLSSFSDTSVVAGTLYYYNLFSCNSYGYSSGTAISAIPGKTTLSPPKIANGSIVIDGSDSDSAWSSSPRFDFSFAEAYGESGGTDSVSGYVRLAYDDSNFYMFYKSNDKYVWVDGAGGEWTEDGIEVFFDMNFNRQNDTIPDADDFHLIFTASPAYFWKGRGDGPGGVTWDTSWNPAISSAIVVDGTLNNNADTDTSWSLEWKIPFSDLGIVSINPGQSIGFTFWINEDDTVGHAAQHWYVYTPGTASTNTSTWGIAQF